MLTFDDSGKVSHEWDYLDGATLIGQLQPSKEHSVRSAAATPRAPAEVAIAKGDAAETANLSVLHELVDAFDKHDVMAVGAQLGDASVTSVQPMSKDETKKETLAELAKVWKQASDLEVTISDTWAAGDLVGAVETVSGTMNGKKLSVPVLAIHRIDHGKIGDSWIFFQNASLSKQLSGPKK